MSAEQDKEDLTVGNDDLVNVNTYKIEIKVEASESEDEDLAPLVDPLSPSSDLIPTTRSTRKRHAKTVLYEGFDSNSEEGSDWEPEEVEPKLQTPHNKKVVKIIKIDDGLSSASSNQGKNGGGEVGRTQRLGRRQKLKAAKFEVTGEAELDVRCSGSQRSQQTYLERYEAQKAKRREQNRKLRERMTPEQKAEQRRKVSMYNTLKNAAMTEEQRQEQRHKDYMRRVIRQTKKSAEELEGEKEKQRAMSREYQRKMKATEEQRKVYLERGRQYFRKFWRGLTPEERRRRILKYKPNANARKTPEQREKKRQQSRLSWGKYDLRQKLTDAGVPPEQISEKVRDFVANFVAKPPPERICRPRRHGPIGPSVELDSTLIAHLEPTERRCLERRFRNAKNYYINKLTAAGVPPEQMEEKFKELKASYEKLGRLDGEDYRRPSKLRSNETPEQKESRLMKVRVAVAKTTLKKRLSASGAPPELIEEKLRELVAKYEAKAQAEIIFRPHKPRAKQKRCISSSRHHLGETQSSFSPSPSSPNSYCEPGDDQPYCNPSPVPDASPPQIGDRGAIEMSSHQQIQMHPEWKMTHSKESLKSSLGNNTLEGSSILIPTLDLKSLVSKSTVPHETTLPHPPEQTPSSPPPEVDFSDDDWVEEGENKDSDQEEFVPPNIPPRSPCGGTAKRRPGRKSDGPRGSYKAAAKGSLVICEICGNGYSADYIVKHNKIVHNPNWVNGKCVICGMEFSVGRKFLKHYNSAHLYAGLPKGKARSKMRLVSSRRKFMTAAEKEVWKSRPVVCKLCGISLRRGDIAEHKRVEHHPEYKEGKCRFCNTEFLGAVDFYDHFQREHREGKKNPWERKKDWICSLCGDGFSSFQYLSTHEYSVHGEGSKEENFPQCPLCGNMYRTSYSLKEHLRKMHPDEESGLVFPILRGWQCRRCGEKCRKNKELLEHVSAQHPDSYFPCVHCERLMYTEQNLNDHVLLCKGNEKDSKPSSEPLAWVPLSCEFCSKQMRISSLKRHYRVVHGVVEECFRCSICSQTFTRRNCWLNHLDRKHGIPLDDELKEEARKMNVSDRSQVEVKNLKGIIKRRFYSRKTRSPKEESGDSSEDEEDKQRKKAGEEIDKRSENERNAQKNKASEKVVVCSRRSTRSRRRRSHVTPEICEVENEKRLRISVVRMDEMEISKWINRSTRIVCKVETEAIPDVF